MIFATVVATLASHGLIAELPQVSIACGCRTVLMCDTEGNRLKRYHLNRVNDMVLSADGRTLITAACEKTIKLLRLHENREVGHGILAQLPQHTCSETGFGGVRSSLVVLPVGTCGLSFGHE